MDNTETLATLDTQDTGQKLKKAEGAMKNGQHRDTSNIGHTGQKLESRRGNQEWTTQRH